MTPKNIGVGVATALAVAVAGYFFFSNVPPQGVVNQEPATQGQINIDAVCEGALAYMTFTDAASADIFVAECKEGKHPEVIEQYRAGLNLDADVAI